jgi:transposase
VAHRTWLDRLQLVGATGAVFREYLHAIDEITGRIERLESEIHEAATQSTRAPVIHALQALRGVQEVTAATLVAEVGQFSRFRHPAQLMAYAGLVPREYSSGSSRWQGGITKVGNAHLRRIIIEAAWAYRHKPSLKVTLRKRQEGQTAQVRDISWRAQVRLHKKYIGLIMRGKGGGVTTAAVARELLGFAWAIACTVEDEGRNAGATAA